MHNVHKLVQNLLMIFLTALCVAVAFAIPARAADDIGFSVVPQIPENQRPGVGGYFDLKVEPGQTQDLVVQVKNTGTEEIVVSVEAITASTTRNGKRR